MSSSLPEGFGAGLDDAFARESAAVTQGRLNALIAAALHHVLPDGEGGLSPMAVHSDTKGVTVRTGAMDGSSLLLVTGTTTVPARPMEVMELIAPHSTADFVKGMAACDPTFKDGLSIPLIGRGVQFDATGMAVNTEEGLTFPFYAVRWGCFGAPWPLWDRDFVFGDYADLVEIRGQRAVSTSEEANDGAGEAAPGIEEADDGRRLFVTVTTAVEAPSMPPREKHVRGSIDFAGYVVEAIDDTSCRVTIAIKVDAKGSVPTWVQNLVAPDQGKNVARMAEYFQARRAAEAALATAPAAASLPWTLDLGRGQVHTAVVAVPAGARLRAVASSEQPSVVLEVGGDGGAWDAEGTPSPHGKGFVGLPVTSAVLSTTFTAGGEGGTATVNIRNTASLTSRQAFFRLDLVSAPAAGAGAS